jgi:hypothetical protein
MVTFLTLTENLKSTGSLHIRKMDLHDGVSHKKSRHSSHKIFDPTLALHWIGRGGSDEGDLRPSQMLCADW